MHKSLRLFTREAIIALISCTDFLWEKTNFREALLDGLQANCMRSLFPIVSTGVHEHCFFWQKSELDDGEVVMADSRIIEKQNNFAVWAFHTAVELLNNRFEYVIHTFLLAK